jgi:hypothetical protein
LAARIPIRRKRNLIMVTAYPKKGVTSQARSLTHSSRRKGMGNLPGSNPFYMSASLSPLTFPPKVLI